MSIYGIVFVIYLMLTLVNSEFSLYICSEFIPQWGKEIEKR